MQVDFNWPSPKSSQRKLSGFSHFNPTGRKILAIGILFIAFGALTPPQCMVAIVKSRFSIRKNNMSSFEMGPSSKLLLQRSRTVSGSGFLFLFFLVCTGCGSSDGLNRKAVSGKVTVDGVAVPNGSISFEPLSTSGVGSGSVITNGKYSISKADGLPPGKYRVQITGDDGANFSVSAGKMPGDEIMPAKKQLVPDSWNSKSKQDIEVKTQGPFKFDFPIDTKKK